MVLKSHLKTLSSVALSLLFLTACKKSNSPLKDILAEESYAQYQKMPESEKKQFEKSIWYFYMYQETDSILHCSTPQANSTADFNIQDVRLLADKIIKDSSGNKYAFRFAKNDSFLCLAKYVSGIDWKNGWPIDIRGASIREGFDTIAFKENTKAYAGFVQEKFKEGPLKKWLLENKPY